MLAPVALLLCAAPASGQEEPSLVLTPSRAESEATRGATLGPFTIRNGTDQRYTVTVVPILLGQARDGGLFVRDDAAALAAARRLLRPQIRRFDFPPGAARSVFALVRRVPKQGAIYGGVLFRARPREQAGGGGRITNVLQLNATLLLRPPPERRRARFTTERIRAEQADRRRLRLLVPVVNRGNTDAAAAGTVTVQNDAGRTVVERRLRSFDVLPGATVDLATIVSKKLRAGRYTLSATLRAGGQRLRSKGTLRLFGTNQVRTQNARLTDFPSPKAHKGEPVEVEATFENTGNIGYAPDAVLEARPVGPKDRGTVAVKEEMQVEEAAPGEKGKLNASIRLPEDAESFTLTVRLLDGTRELDSRSVSVTPTEKPPLLERIGDSLTENALPIIGILAALLLAASVLGLRYVRRLRAAAQQAAATRPTEHEEARPEHTGDDPPDES